MASSPSSRAGMGAIPYPGGTTFRVWAPDVTAAAVTGDFTSWSADGLPLAAEPGGTGMWSADIDDACPGQAYQLVLTDGPVPLTRVDPYARQVVNVNGTAVKAVIYDEGAFDWGSAPYTTPGWTDLVIYELHVASFSEKPGESVGGFGDVIGRLPYLQRLGVSAIEILPVVTFQGAISWGYDPGVPFSVERSYGGPDGLKALVRAAHEHGIAVILDVVYNHFGPPDSILWDFDGSGPTWSGGIYFYGERWPGDPRPQTPWGSRPDYGRPEVRQYLTDNAVTWLEQYRLDGLRLDATAYIRNVDGDSDTSEDIPEGWELLQQINDAVAASQPWKITIAEDMQDNDWITYPVAAQGAGFGAQWDPDFVQQVRAVLEQLNDADRDMTVIQAMLEQQYAASAFSRVVFTESHDADGNGRSRVPTEIDPAQPDSYWAKKRSTLGAALVLTAPGIPMLFQGQEFLEQRPFLQDPAQLDWGNAVTYAGILQLYTDLIHLRRDWLASTGGLQGSNINVFHVDNDAKVIAYHRYGPGGPGDDVVVVLNFADAGYAAYQLGLPRPGTWRVRLNSDWTGYDPSFSDWTSLDATASGPPQDGLSQSAPVGIGPYTAIILSQDPD